MSYRGLESIVDEDKERSYKIPWRSQRTRSYPYLQIQSHHHDFILLSERLSTAPSLSNKTKYLKQSFVFGPHMTLLHQGFSPRKATPLDAVLTSRIAYCESAWVIFADSFHFLFYLILSFFLYLSFSCNFLLFTYSLAFFTFRHSPSSSFLLFSMTLLCNFICFSSI